MRGSADVAIRSQINPDDNLVGRRIPDFVDFTYASPKYLSEHWFEDGQTNAKWLSRGKGASNNRWVNRHLFQTPLCAMYSPPLDQVHAAVAGMGMAALLCFYTDRIEGLVKIPETAAVASRHSFVLWLQRSKLKSH